MSISKVSCSHPRSWIEIDSSSFSHNSALIKNLTSNSHLSLKADAYGHGLLAIAQLAERDDRISSLHVSHEHDLHVLRTHGITKNIIINARSDNPNASVTLLYYGMPENDSDTLNSLQSPLRPVLSWKTTLMRIKQVDSNVPVGYARSFITKRPTRLGILPIGYADGLPRILSNKGAVSIKEMLAPIIGLISMNLIAIDITDIETISQDDEVTVIGPENSEHMAQEAACTQLELVSRLHSTIPRIIVPEFFDKTYARPHHQNADFF